MTSDSTIARVIEKTPKTTTRPLGAVLFTASLASLTCIVVVVALSASGFAFYMGLGELSRRAGAATRGLSPVAKALLVGTERGASPQVRLDSLGLDPDVESAAIVGPYGRILAHYARSHDDTSLRTAQPPGSTITWSVDHVVATTRFDQANGSGRLVLTYSTQWAKHRAFRQFLVFLAGGLSALVGVAVLLRTIIVRQLAPWRTLTQTMIAFVDRDYTRPIPALDHRGEMGAFARAAVTFRTKLIEHDRLQTEADAAHSNTARLHAKMEIEVDRFRATMRDALNEVANLSNQMTIAADGLKTIATQTSERADSASVAIGQTSSNVGIVAAASEELSASIHEIERQVEQTRSTVVDATRRTAETSAVVSGLSAKADQIGDMIVLIQSIAAQTNLLSLNATIEAARAGDAGRGFAIVAQEVKTLADQTSGASRLVAEHVQAIQNATLDAVSAISEIGSAVAEADRYSAIITEAVERQAVATGEISRSASRAARSAEEAAGSMKRLSTAVDETDQSAAQVHCFATDVGRQAEDLRKTIDLFLQETTRVRGLVQ